MPRKRNVILHHIYYPSCCSCYYKPGDLKSNSVCHIRGKRMEIWLRYIRRRYYITVNGLVMASVKLTKGLISTSPVGTVSFDVFFSIPISIIKWTDERKLGKKTFKQFTKKIKYNRCLKNLFTENIGFCILVYYSCKQKFSNIHDI